jgi:hypothetical protein
MSRNKKLAIALIILIIAILGAIVFATGNKDDNKHTAKHDTQKTAKAEQKTENETANAQPQVEGDSTTVADQETTPAPTTTHTSTSNVKTAASTTSTPAPTSTIPTNNGGNSQTQTPPTEVTPPTNNDNNSGDTSTEPAGCFVKNEDTIYAPVGGNSPSYTLSTVDGSSVLWWSFGESMDISDAGTNVKPGFPVYIVVEDEGFSPMTASPSITFHIHARDTAPLGDYCPADEMTQVGIAAYDPDTYMPIDSNLLNITVVPATEVL